MMRFDTINTLAALNAAAVTAAAADKIGNKRVYYCQRCLNHNRLEPRKNHKCECLYATCTCNKCILVEKRRVLNTQLHELEEVVEGENDADIDEQYSAAGARIKGERVPNCQKCGQHGRKSRLKGHKRVCPYRDCNCAKCQVVSERQKLMADQIKIRRRQRKDTLMNITRENITATLNAAAVVAAAAPIPYLNNFNALLYKQLQQNMQPASSFITSTSPTGSAAESTSYSPTNSLSYFTPSPTNMLKAAVTGPAGTPSLGQVPLLFANPASNVAAAPSASSSAPSTPSSPQIAMPVAINPLLGAGASTASLVSQASTLSNSLSASQTTALAAATLPSVLDNEKLFQSFLANMRLLEQKMCANPPRDEAPSAFVDVCSM